MDGRTDVRRHLRQRLGLESSCAPAHVGSWMQRVIDEFAQPRVARRAVKVPVRTPESHPRAAALVRLETRPTAQCGLLRRATACPKTSDGALCRADAAVSRGHRSARQFLTTIVAVPSRFDSGADGHGGSQRGISFVGLEDRTPRCFASPCRSTGARSRQAAAFVETRPVRGPGCARFDRCG